MRQVQKGKRRKPRKKTEPLAEGIRKKRRPRDFFTSMSNDELVEYAREIVEEKGILSKGELKKADGGLYKVLLERKLINSLDFEKVQRDWASMSDEEVSAYARRLMKKKKIKSRSKLQKTDGSLYGTLRKRRLLDMLALESKKRKPRYWASMSDEEVFEYAKKLMREKKIRSRGRLQKADNGLYLALLKRKLLDKLKFKIIRRTQRKWTFMNDEELIGHAREFMKEKKIRSRSRLEEMDAGLYSVLWRRRLIDSVFAAIESDRKREAIQDVLDAMSEFGD